MKLNFVSGPGMKFVLYTKDMAEDETFGNAISCMCTDKQLEVKEWNFMFNPKCHVPWDLTPAGMGPPDEGNDVMTIYCRPVKQVDELTRQFDNFSV